jgi:hypothetical protein
MVLQGEGERSWKEQQGEDERECLEAKIIHAF